MQNFCDHNLFKQWKVRTVFGNIMFFLTCSLRSLRSNDVWGWGWNLIEFHKMMHLVNIETSRLSTTILPRIFYLLINFGIPHPFFRYIPTYVPISSVLASSLSFDKRQLSEQHIAHRIKFRNYESIFSNFVLIDSIK